MCQPLSFQPGWPTNPKQTTQHKQGAFFYHARMDPRDPDFAAGRLNRDAATGLPFKAFATAGAAGAFAVDAVTGPGQAMGGAEALVAMARSSGAGERRGCVDTWTLAPVAVPVAGLTPYPEAAAARGGRAGAPHVAVTPLALLTLHGDAAAGGGLVAEKYAAARAALGVEAGAGGDDGGVGAVDGDPLQMLRSGDARAVGVGVQSLAAGAQVLTTLTAARALYECREGAGARLSHELFGQWGRALLRPATMRSPPELSRALSDLCLAHSASDAANAAAAVNTRLEAIAVSAGLL